MAYLKLWKNGKYAAVEVPDESIQRENGITPKDMQRRILEPLLDHGLPEEALDRYLADWEWE